MQKEAVRIAGKFLQMFGETETGLWFCVLGDEPTFKDPASSEVRIRTDGEFLLVETEPLQKEGVIGFKFVGRQKGELRYDVRYDLWNLNGYFVLPRDPGLCFAEIERAVTAA